VIKDGVAANKDLKLLGPFVRMDGAGLIDIGRQSMDYRVAPRAVASAEGQGGKQDLAGLGIPFRIKGPWRKLSYEPDLSGIANSAVDAILKGKNPLNGLKEDGGLGDFLSGIGGKKSTEDTTTNGATPPTKTPEKENKVDPLKDILGGGQ
jgi:AsmA protein